MAISAWLRNNVVGGGDYRPEAGPSKLKAATYGAAGGAAVGAVWGGANAAADNPYWEDVTHWVPRPELGPSPDRVFGSQAAALLRDVSARSSGDGSARDTMQYLAYLSSRSNAAAPTMGSLYNTLENHVSDDRQVRGALNLIAAYVDKNPGESPFRAASLFIEELGRRGSYDRAATTFAGQHQITQQDLSQSELRHELRHTTVMGRFGVLGGVAIGMLGGAALGAGVGLATGVLIDMVTRAPVD